MYHFTCLMTHGAGERILIIVLPSERGARARRNCFPLTNVLFDLLDIFV